MRFGGRKEKKNSKLGAVGTYLLVMGILGVLFAVITFGFFYSAAPALVSAGYGWICMTYAVIAGVLFAVIGSVFMSQSALYRAKDNDLLLSMPIPPWQILFSRMLPLYAQNFYFCFIFIFPAYIAYGIVAGVSFPSVIFLIIGLLIIPLFSLTLCCLLGFIVAVVASRVKHANIISVIISLILFAAYFFVYFQIDNAMNALIDNAGQVAGGIKAFAYPLYLVGRMMEGDLLGAFVTLAICCIPFALLYFILSKTYFGIITRGGNTAKTVYRGKKLKKTSVWGGLIGKESKRFFRSTAYLLNCGIGVIMLAIFAVVLAIFGGKFCAGIGEAAPALIPFFAPVVCLIICLTSAMDGVSAPSVSLEGKSLYVLQSLPVESWKPLFAKVFFHIIFNAPAAVVCGIVGAIVLRASAISTVMLVLMPVATNFLFAALGLFFNLKKPVLDWDNETTLIKQSISVVFLMLSVMVVFGALVGLFFAARYIMSVDIYLLICFFLVTLGAVGVMFWIKRRGAVIWENL